MKDDDFGFTLESAKTIAAVHTGSYLQAYEELYSMVTPLLRNLTKDPEKEYLHWPNRAQKMEEFVAKIEQHAIAVRTMAKKS